MSACKRRRQDLSLLASGALDADEAEAARRHLDGCADCRGRYEALRELCGGLRNLAGETAEATVPEDLHERVVRAVTAERTGGPRAAPRRVARPRLEWVALAAAACVVVGLVAWDFARRGAASGQPAAAASDDREIEACAVAAGPPRAADLPSHIVYLSALRESPDKLDALLRRHGAVLLQPDETGTGLRRVRDAENPPSAGKDEDHGCVQKIKSRSVACLRRSPGRDRCVPGLG